MKRPSGLLVCNLFMLCFCLCCTQIDMNGNRTSISISESKHYYKMQASFNKNKTRNVEAYMDKMIGRTSNMSFINTQIDGTISLDDQTNFYIQKSPGKLEIKLNKDQNSTGSYYEVKEMCEGIKNVIAK